MAVPGKKRYRGLSVLDYMVTSNHVTCLYLTRAAVISSRIRLSWSQAEPGKNKGRQAKWTQSVAVGGESFIEKIKEALGFRAKGRKIRRAGDSFEPRETLQPYGTTNALASGNPFYGINNNPP